MATTDQSGSVNPEAAKKKTLLRVRVSEEEEEFVISESGAALSETLKNKSADVADGVINLSSNVVRSCTLPMIISYLETHADDGLSDEEKANFDRDFASGVKDFELLKKIATDSYNLNIRGLQTLMTEKLAAILRTKSLRWGRRAIFGPGSDPTPEEKAEWRREVPEIDWDAEDERQRRLEEQEDLEEEQAKIR